MSTLRRRYSSSRRPYARRCSTRILLLNPSTKPSGISLFSGWQYKAMPSQCDSTSRANRWKGPRRCQRSAAFHCSKKRRAQPGLQ